MFGLERLERLKIAKSPGGWRSVEMASVLSVKVLGAACHDNVRQETKIEWQGCLE